MDSIVSRLRNHAECDIADLEEAANMLEFLFRMFDMHSPKMNGQHSYRFQNSGWPMTHAKGRTAEDAIRAAMAEVESVRSVKAEQPSSPNP